MNVKNIFLTTYLTLFASGYVYGVLNQEAFNTALLRFAPAGSTLVQAATYVEQNLANIASLTTLNNVTNALGESVESNTIAYFLGRGSSGLLGSYFKNADTNMANFTAALNAARTGTTTTTTTTPTPTTTTPTTTTTTTTDTNINAAASTTAAANLYTQIQEAVTLCNSSVTPIKTVGGRVPFSQLTLTTVA